MPSDLKPVRIFKPNIVRTILGLNILTGFKSDGKEWKGQIYDPKSGKTYRSIVYKGQSGNLVVKGCIGPFCQAQTWTPAG